MRRSVWGLHSRKPNKLGNYKKYTIVVARFIVARFIELRGRNRIRLTFAGGFYAVLSKSGEYVLVDFLNLSFYALRISGQEIRPIFISVVVRRETGIFSQ